MGEGEPGVDLNSPKDNSMTLLVRLMKGGHGTSLFLFYSYSCLSGFLG